MGRHQTMEGAVNRIEKLSQRRLAAKIRHLEDETVKHKAAIEAIGDVLEYCRSLQKQEAPNG